MPTLFRHSCGLVALGALVILAAPAAPSAAQPPASQPAMSEGDMASYAIGVQFAQSVNADAVELNLPVFIQAVHDVLDGRPLALSDAELNATVARLNQDIQARRMAAQHALMREHQDAGRVFLAANAEREDVLVLPSGLQYRVMRAGTGPAPAATDSVRVHYRGTLIDGTEFDSSYTRGQPATFPVGGVIRGWTEGLQLMQEGAKWELFIPSTLAYGPAGRPSIPPNATLIFEVELIEVIPPAAAAATQPARQPTR